MNEQKNPIPQDRPYLLTAGTPPAEPPVDPFMAVDDPHLLRDAYAGMRALYEAQLASANANAMRVHLLYEVIRRERETSKRLRERWMESIKSDADFRAKAAQESKEREALITHLRSELDAARKPRRKGGRK